MAKATAKKQPEPRRGRTRYGGFTPRVGLKRLRLTIRQERPGRPRIIPRACGLYKNGMGMRPTTRGMWRAHTTARRRLPRMMGADPDRRIDGGRKKGLTPPDKAITEWDDSPAACGFAACTWRPRTMPAMLYREPNIECKPPTLRRAPNRTGRPHAKARPIPRKPAAKEEREGLMGETGAAP